MKLLFDGNLSPKLPKRLQELFPGAVHLFDLPLPRNAADRDIWRYGQPPKIILLESWRYPTRIAFELIRANAILISEFARTGQDILILRA